MNDRTWVSLPLRSWDHNCAIWICRRWMHGIRTYPVMLVSWILQELEVTSVLLLYFVLMFSLKECIKILYLFTGCNQAKQNCPVSPWEQGLSVITDRATCFLGLDDYIFQLMILCEKNQWNNSRRQVSKDSAADRVNSWITFFFLLEHVDHLGNLQTLLHGTVSTWPFMCRYFENCRSVSIWSDSPICFPFLRRQRMSRSCWRSLGSCCLTPSTWRRCCRIAWGHSKNSCTFRTGFASALSEFETMTSTARYGEVNVMVKKSVLCRETITVPEASRKRILRTREDDCGVKFFFLSLSWSWFTWRWTRIPYPPPLPEIEGCGVDVGAVK